MSVFDFRQVILKFAGGRVEGLDVFQAEALQE
jgi:hypothetical protein